MIKNYAELKNKLSIQRDYWEKEYRRGVLLNPFCDGGLTTNLIYLAEGFLVYVKESQGMTIFENVPPTLSAIMIGGPFVIGLYVARVSYEKEKKQNKEKTFNLK